MTEKENLPRATGAPARSAKPFDHKIKLTPRHRRASHLKEKTNPAATPQQIVITDPQERKRVLPE
ncbi:hypothetical protein [Faecalibacterium prausnitzii]|uniref:hypothetical protein n=1 Tax=Faecalibacterium prausnitzii TaxID=853 RepID=UPI00130EC7DD|nr:hypothetical protein [Faecalibacterium prausnitzii]